MTSDDQADWDYKDVTFPAHVTKENLDALENFKIRDDDTVLVSYPKTGTNFVGVTVARILKAAGKTGESADDMITHPLEATLSSGSAKQPTRLLLEEKSSPRLVLTHLPIDFVPEGISKPQNKVKVLVTMRNPKDTAVSTFHFAKNLMQATGIQMNKLVPWPEFAQNFLDGKVVLGDYCDHLLGWWQMRDDPHFLFIKYEDMKKDLLSSVKNIAAFLEVNIDDVTIAAIAEASTFQSMKVELSQSKAPERRVNARKGIVGDWKNMFSPEQSQAFDAWYEKKLGGTGINFEFE
ncbi:sulfotransferase 1 [Branchiostoma belcheri]|nr:sulfotransferase 1 [Branchiostoma belcheri]